MLDFYISLLNNSKTQIFLTTQNKDLIEKIVENLEDVEIIYLFKNGEFRIINRETAIYGIWHKWDLR